MTQIILHRNYLSNGELQLSRAISPSDTYEIIYQYMDTTAIPICWSPFNVLECVMTNAGIPTGPTFNVTFGTLTADDNATVIAWFNAAFDAQTTYFNATTSTVIANNIATVTISYKTAGDGLDLNYHNPATTIEHLFNKNGQISETPFNGTTDILFDISRIRADPKIIEVHFDEGNSVGVSCNDTYPDIFMATTDLTPIGTYFTVANWTQILTPHFYRADFNDLELDQNEFTNEYLIILRKI